MKYKKLGRTTLDVSVVAMGCWAIAGGKLWGEQDERDSIATIQEALDLGINFFDTAEGYGDGYSEVVLGKALAGRRQEAVIASKVSPNHLRRDELVQACERSLQRLQVETIDLYQIHWPNWDVPIEETWRALETLQDAGKIRAIGVSNFGVQDLSGLLEVGHCETDQLPYSLLWRAIEFQIQELCLANDVGILCYSPMAQGLLTGKFASADEVPEGRARTRHFSQDRPLARHQEAGFEEATFAAIAKIRQIAASVNASMAQVSLAWALTQPGVTAVLAGARTPEQIRENAAAAELTLSPDVLKALSAATDDLKENLGPDPDQYTSDSRYR